MGAGRASLTFAAMPELYANIYVDRRPQSEPVGRRRPIDKEKEPTGWSPDGRTLAYVVFENTGQVRNQDLWMSTFDPRRAGPARRAAVRDHIGGRSQRRVFAGRPLDCLRVERRAAGQRLRVAARRSARATRCRPGRRSIRSGSRTRACSISIPKACSWRTTIPAEQSERASRRRGCSARRSARPGTSRNNYAVAPDKETPAVQRAGPYDAGPTTFSVVVNWRWVWADR